MAYSGGQIDAETTPVHAAVDIGTNSFHMVVARGLPDGGFEVITTMKEMVRLGQGSREMKQLADDAIDRGVDCLGRMAAMAATHGADITAVATSATREAENRQVFIDRALTETGIKVEVISGFEEARLIHLGVLQALPVYDRRLLLVDIGGGSTEFLIGQGSEVLAARSMKLGAIRLTERFFGDGQAAPKDAQAPSKKPLARQVRRCSAHVAATLTAVADALEEGGRHEVAVGSSGTIQAIAAMIAAARGEEPADLNGFTFTADELASLVSMLVELSPEKRRRVPGLDSRRADIIVGGALLLEGAFETFEIDEMVVSGYALREGVLFDRMAADRAQSARRLTDLRRTNALRLAHQLDPDAPHAETAARLALSLFDQTVDLHGLGDEARELLELAAIVHNVGLFISHASHHKHSYYVVRHSEQLTGFTERERELLALIARYHRRSHPKPRHDEFSALSASERDLVRKLSGILRIAIGLDRSHRGLVDEVRAESSGSSLMITPLAEAGTDLSLEVFSAQERAHLLAEAIDSDVLVQEPEG